MFAMKQILETAGMLQACVARSRRIVVVRVDAETVNRYSLVVSTVIEIEAALSGLTTEELRRVEQALHQQYRQRHDGIIYDDKHGVVTEADLISSADEAFLMYDKEEQKDAQRRTR